MTLIENFPVSCVNNFRKAEKNVRVTMKEKSKQRGVCFCSGEHFGSESIPCAALIGPDESRSGTTLSEVENTVVEREIRFLLLAVNSCGTLVVLPRWMNKGPFTLQHSLSTLRIERWIGDLPLFNFFRAMCAEFCTGGALMTSYNEGIRCTETPAHTHRW